MTTQEYARNKQHENIAASLTALTSTDGWQNWLSARRRFHTYSLGNQLLIACQRPDATLVRGFQQWRNDFNRQVQKGSKAIWILAPMTKKLKTAAGEDEKKLFFRSVKVFDVADTKQIEGAEEIPLESPIKGGEVGGESHQWAIGALQEFASEELGYLVDYVPIEGGALGRCNSTTKRISIECTLCSNAQVRVLVHEISHALDVTYEDYSRPQAELICDTVAWLVCDTIGLDVSTANFAYILNWDPEAIEDLRTFTALIDQNAKRIEGPLLAELAEPSATH